MKIVLVRSLLRGRGNNEGNNVHTPVTLNRSKLPSRNLSEYSLRDRCQAIVTSWYGDLLSLIPDLLDGADDSSGAFESSQMVKTYIRQR